MKEEGSRPEGVLEQQLLMTELGPGLVGMLVPLTMRRFAMGVQLTQMTPPK